jgi:NADH:ubiquinone oxidoreductase subunit B-like Fe-S oxidoreductase
MQIRDDLADKGFLTATTEELITWARTGSLMWMTFGLACCAIEMMQMSMPPMTRNASDLHLEPRPYSPTSSS